MKRRFPVFILLMLIILFASPVSAMASTTYSIPELYMMIDFPDEGYVFTKNIDDNHPGLAALIVTKEALSAYMEEKFLYLEYICPEPYFEISIQKVEYPGTKEINNFNIYSEEELETIGEYYMDATDEEFSDLVDQVDSSDSYNINKPNYTGYSIYENNGINYVILDYWQLSENIKFYSKQYYTIYNGQAINIVLLSYNEPPTNQMISILESVVDSIVFTETLAAPTTTNQKTDTSTGLSEKIISIVTKAALIFLPASIALYISRYRNEKKRKELIQQLNDNDDCNCESPYNREDASPLQPLSQTKCCRQCGFPLPTEDSQYCVRCGTKVLDSDPIDQNEE